MIRFLLLFVTIVLLIQTDAFAQRRSRINVNAPGVDVNINQRGGFRRDRLEININDGRQNFHHQRQNFNGHHHDFRRNDFRRSDFRGSYYYYAPQPEAIRIPLDGGHCSPSAPASFLYFSY